MQSMAKAEFCSMMVSIFDVAGSKRLSALLRIVGWVISNDVKNYVSTINPVTHLKMEV